MGSEKIFPANWKEIIRGKKIVFYNTSIGSMLQGGKKHIEKMEWVFRVFQKHPEVVLWWRPHPLELSTLQSMRPELVKQYRELKKQYQKENVGILDESADVNRAMTLADSYYGDWSSLAHIFKAVGKPVLFENDEIKKATAPLYNPCTFCVKGDYIWFIQLNSNKLVKVKRDTADVEKIIDIPMKSAYEDCRYNHHIIQLDNKLILLFENSSKLYEYDVEADILKVCDFGIENYLFHSEIVLSYENRLIMFPCYSEMIESSEGDLKFVKRKNIFPCDIRLSKIYDIVGDVVYMVNKGSNQVYKYNLRDNNCRKIEIGDISNQYWGIKRAGKYFVLPHIDKKMITLWDEKSGIVIRLDKFPEEYSCLEGWAYLDMYEKEGDVYIFPFYANMIVKVDTTGGSITQAFKDIFWNVKYDEAPIEKKVEFYLSSYQIEETVYAYATYKKCWQIFDFNTMTVRDSRQLEVKSLEHKKKIEELLNGECGGKDASFFTSERMYICDLENYITNIYEKCKSKKENDGDNGCIGKEIYRQILER